MSDCGNKVYEHRKYFAVALDPIHIGTGGYRIGRVDSTIVREPSTDIPKIPGTTIEGVCRSYAFLRIMENGKLSEELKKNGFDQQCAKGKVKKEGDRKIEPCGKCPICITFGYTTDTKSLQAMALFSDARILFFPVATMVGPVWVTSPMTLREAGITENERDIEEPSNNTFISAVNFSENKLNFGWMLLNKDNSKSVNPENLVCEGQRLYEIEKLKPILNRIAIVPENLFSAIVNSNLEVRTSVAIDPERGTAEEKALFTYEAVPRGTVFWIDVTFQNPSHFPSINEDPLVVTKSIEAIIKTVEDGFSLFEYLGVGGMSSRGFGRLDVLNSHINEEEYILSFKNRVNELKKQLNTVDNSMRTKIGEEIKKLCDFLTIIKDNHSKEKEKLEKLISLLDEVIKNGCDSG